MGWKGTVRSLAATARAVERESRRKQRELEKERQYFAKMEELEQANYEVEVYENYIDRITSVHKECSPEINWNSILSEPKPKEPSRTKENEDRARAMLENYNPSLMSKLFGSVEKKIAALESDIENAKKTDEERHEAASVNYQSELADWTKQENLARRIMDTEPAALIQVLEEIGSFSEIEDLGSQIQFHVTEEPLVFCNVKVHSKEIIPEQSKSLLKSGRLSQKNLPKGRFFELYQDYVCGVILRIANEVFSMLPVENVIVTASDDMLDTRTGHIAEQPIVSALIPRDSLRRLNLDLIDPSDSLENFIHNMNFKKTNGFSPVKEVQPVNS